MYQNFIVIFSILILSGCSTLELLESQERTEQLELRKLAKPPALEDSVPAKETSQ